MRDFYDLHELSRIYRESMEPATLKAAFLATCKKRDSLSLLTSGAQILTKVQQDANLMALWASYQRKYSYAANITYEDVMQSASQLWRDAI